MKIAEKKSLLKQDFTDWTKDDFNQFIEAIERYGRHDKGKSQEEVVEYGILGSI